MSRLNDLRAAVVKQEHALELLADLERHDGWREFAATLRAALIGRRQQAFQFTPSSLDDCIQLVRLQGECAGIELAGAIVETLKRNAEADLENLRIDLASEEATHGDSARVSDDA